MNTILKQKAYFDQEAQDFLSKVAGILDGETLRRAGQGQIRLEDATHYVRKAITGQGGTNDLISNTTLEKVGIVSFDKARLAEGEHLVLKALRISYGTTPQDGGTTNPAEVNYSSIKSNHIPAALRGANLSILQDGKVVFKRAIEDLMNDGISEGNSTKNSYQLINWKAIVAGRPFEMKLEYAEGLNVPADAHHFIEVRLIGAKTVLK
ncbi:MAG: hypothetical protein KY428_12170 [Bacteroidetes bacterium]|nr:hypothetical protein [Bacteroidota bacterium]